MVWCFVIMLRARSGLQKWPVLRISHTRITHLIPVMVAFNRAVIFWIQWRFNAFFFWWLLIVDLLSGKDVQPVISDGHSHGFCHIQKSEKDSSQLKVAILPAFLLHGVRYFSRSAYPVSIRKIKYPRNASRDLSNRRLPSIWFDQNID